MELQFSLKTSKGEEGAFEIIQFSRIATARAQQANAAFILIGKQ